MPVLMPYMCTSYSKIPFRTFKGASRTGIFQRLFFLSFSSKLLHFQRNFLLFTLYKLQAYLKHDEGCFRVSTKELYTMRL